MRRLRPIRHRPIFRASARFSNFTPTVVWSSPPDKLDTTFLEVQEGRSEKPIRCQSSRGQFG